MVEKLRPRYTFTEDRIEELKVVVPEAFADGKINWDVLREALGDHLEDEETERFGLFWPGKREARRLATMPSSGTLVPVPDEGLGEDLTRNIFIEGENLEVLKALQKSYAKQVKLIYIDPPYNTGNDFIYQDDLSAPLDEYLRIAGMLSDEGEQLSTNTRADGRFHTNWMSMIYPRLVVSRSLLSTDGAIFISVDNTELAHLRLICNEVFGEENFVDCLVWFKKVSPSNDAKWFSSDHDYLVIYARDKSQWYPNRLERTAKQESYYKNPDDDPRGPWNSATYTSNKSKKERPNLYYSITNPNTGNEVWPKDHAVWAYSREQYKKHSEDSRIYWGKHGTAGMPRLKLFLSEARGVVTRSVWHYSDVGHTQEGTQEYLKLFPQGGFDYPKPPRLIRKILDLATEKDRSDLVLDFYAGSGTTGQAVLEKNALDGGNRRFVMVQLQEPSGMEEFITINEITKERLRRVVLNLNLENEKEKPGQDIDLGFKVYRLARSSFLEWDVYEGSDAREYQTTLAEYAATSLVDVWKPEDVLTEVLLQQGFPLDSRISVDSQISSNTVYQVRSEAHEFCLRVCLDIHLAIATAEELFNKPKDDVFICLDTALSDELKMQLADAVNLYVI